MKSLRENDDNCYLLSKMQANIFEQSSIDNIPSAYFVKVFANSIYAKMMDNLDFFNSSLSENDIYQNVKDNVKMSRGTVYPDYVMHWVGYILRGWSYLYKVNTNSILKKIPLSSFVKAYYPYHSLDVTKAIERIADDNKVDLTNTLENKLKKILSMTFDL